MDQSEPTRLLLVDDEATLREPLADYLVRQGFVVDQAASAAEARTRLLTGTLALALVVGSLVAGGTAGTIRALAGTLAACTARSTASWAACATKAVKSLTPSANCRHGI